MKNLNNLEEFIDSSDIAVYDGVDGLLNSMFKPKYSVQSYYNDDGSLHHKAVTFNNGILSLVATKDNEKNCYGLLLGVIEGDMQTGFSYDSHIGEIILYGELLKNAVFTDGVDMKSLKKYFKALNSKKERNILIDDEFDYLEKNPYISLDILDLATQDIKTVDLLITIIFSKMMKLYGEELFALGGESSHFKKDVDSVREIFTLFFKDIKEKYLPMIEL